MTVSLSKTISYMHYLASIPVSYSMYGTRTGADGTADCSGAVYTSLRNAGASSAGVVLSTETLHDWLKANGFKLIAEDCGCAKQYGDIFIWGRRGQSAKEGGHTGIFVDSQNIIHCNATANGVSVTNYDRTWEADGEPYFYIYRYYGAEQAPVDPNIVTIYYKKGYGVNAVNGQGKTVVGSNQKLKTGTSWHASGIYVLNGKPVYALGRDLPGWYGYQAYTDQVDKCTINYKPGYGINAYDSKGNQIKGTNTKFKTGTPWKFTGLYLIKGQLFYKVSKTEFIPVRYTHGSGITRFD
ncbi:peptidoglycan amidohydrolase family protein [Xylocopilactobacillus apis]|nr:peptidoglycan amidohydrolase family protein [Xylocopilactobacillus apis]